MKTLFSLSSLSLVLSLSIIPVAQADSFVDVDHSHPYGNAIDYVKEQGIVKGYPDGTYKPDKTINRAEFTKIIIGATFPGEASGENCFSDVQAEWFAAYVCLAQSKGIIGGYADGTFKPDQNISFVEAAKIIVGAFGHTVESDEVWYKPFVMSLESKKSIPRSIASFEHQITRGEMAEIIHRLKASITSKASKSYNELAGLPEESTIPQTITIDIQGFAFSQQELSINVGDTVIWTNKDTAPHNVISTSGSVLQSEDLGNGESYQHTFTEAGTFEYLCTIHPAMTGKIIVN